MNSTRRRLNVNSALPLLLVPLLTGALAVAKAKAKGQPQPAAKPHAVMARQRLIGHCAVGMTYAALAPQLKGARVVTHRKGARVTVFAEWPGNRCALFFDQGSLAYATERQRVAGVTYTSFLDLDHPLVPAVISVPGGLWDPMETSAQL